MVTPRRVKANRRRWANPMPILRVKREQLSAAEAEAIIARFRSAQRHRQPVLITPDVEVYR